MLAYIVTQSKSVTLFINQKTYNLDKDNPGYSSIATLMKQWKAADEKNRERIEKELVELLSKSKMLQGHVTLRDGKVYWGKQELHNSLVDRIVQIDQLGFPPEPMLLFLQNILANPSEQSRNELYDFLEHKNLPITEDGCFLAYKAIRHDYKDKYSGTIDNHPGKVIEFDRSKVDPDRLRECSYGLHVGAPEYVKSYGGNASDRFVIVKVNPRDAVSVPRDHCAQKLRVCKYEVLSEVERNTLLDLPVYSADGSKYSSIDDFNADQLWEDDDYYDDIEEEEDEYLDDVFSSDDEDDTLEQDNLFIQERIQYYDETYDRDNVCRLAKERDLVRTIEAARDMGKQAVCALLAGNDVE